VADYREFFQGRFINFATLDGKPDATLRIRRVTGEDVEGPDGDSAKGPKLVVYFDGDTKPWIPCKTTAACLAAMFETADYDQWAGRQVTLYGDKAVRAFGAVGGIRVRGMPGLREKVTVKVKRPKRKEPDVYVLVDTAPRDTRPPADLDAVLAAEGLTMADLDAWATAHSKPPASGLDAEARAKTARWIIANPAVFGEIRAAKVAP
jgi:hypothetical protein